MKTEVDMKVFNATHIKCYEEDDVLIVAVGDDAADPHNFIIMTRLDDEDTPFTDGDVGLQTESTEYEMAGAIQKIGLSESRLKVEIKSNFQEHFNGEAIVAEFQGTAVDGESIDLLRKSLHTLVEGSGIEMDF
ncbi:hypothetical protein APT63_08040 [Pseudomonas sp. 22-AL-CL-001]|nr:hypothetical protein APT63_08040 [Pseudomonas monteilii]